jgi:DNA-binding transcriptional ArsR family regulator
MPTLSTGRFAGNVGALFAVEHETGMNKGTLSSHLSRLEEAGYVEVTKTYPRQSATDVAAAHCNGPQSV